MSEIAVLDAIVIKYCATVTQIPVPASYKTAVAGVAISVTSLNTIRPGFEYYVVVTDPRGCRKSTRGKNKSGMVVCPVVQRDYALYFRWQSEEEIDDTPPAPPPAVNDRAALAASDIILKQK
ncbi:MAG: hypothetical protein LBV41_07445 [Cytophagaceae bacterium]|nr:hypothetical protein [Cytophagaceae bacterium]